MAQCKLIQPFCIGHSLTGQQAPQGGDPNATYGAWLAEAATQTWVQGDFVYIDSGATYKLSVCTSGGSNNTMNSAIAGQAIKKASGVTSTQHRIRIVRPDEYWIGNVYHGTIGSATTQMVQLGAAFALRRVSNKWHVDIETTAEDASTAIARVKVVGFYNKGLIETTAGELSCQVPLTTPVPGTAGDTYGLVVFRFLDISFATDSDPRSVRLLQLA